MMEGREREMYLKYLQEEGLEEPTPEPYEYAELTQDEKDEHISTLEGPYGRDYLNTLRGEGMTQFDDTMGQLNPEQWPSQRLGMKTDGGFPMAILTQLERDNIISRGQTEDAANQERGGVRAIYRALEKPPREKGILEQAYPKVPDEIGNIRQLLNRRNTDWG